MKDINLFKTKDSIYLKRVKSKDEISRDLDCDGFLIESSERETRKIIQSLKGSGKLIAFVGGDDAFNRRALESLKIDYLVSPERGDKRDSLKQRDSGLNHVVAKIAKDKGVAVVINVSELSKLSGKKKALRIERIVQNVKVCRKAGCDVKIVSLAVDKKNVVDEKGRVAIGVSLGMSSSQSSSAVRF